MYSLFQTIWGQLPGFCGGEPSLTSVLSTGFSGAIHKLRWMGALIELHFVDSHANPADPVSWVFEHWSSKQLILEAHAHIRLYEADVAHLCWGHISDRDRMLH